MNAETQPECFRVAAELVRQAVHAEISHKAANQGAAGNAEFEHTLNVEYNGLARVLSVRQSATRQAFDALCANSRTLQDVQSQEARRLLMDAAWKLQTEAPMRSMSEQEAKEWAMDTAVSWAYEGLDVPFSNSPPPKIHNVPILPPPPPAPKFTQEDVSRQLAAFLKRRKKHNS